MIYFVDYNLIGESIREFRKKNNLSQEQLAEALGMEQYQISLLENARPGSGIDSLSKLTNMCSALEIPVSISVGGKDILMKELNTPEDYEDLYWEEQEKIDQQWYEKRMVEWQIVDNARELFDSGDKKFIAILNIFKSVKENCSICEPYYPVIHHIGSMPSITINEIPYCQQLEALKNIHNQIGNPENMLPHIQKLEKLAKKEQEEMDDEDITIDEYDGPTILNFYDILHISLDLHKQDYNFENQAIFQIPFVNDEQITIDFRPRNPAEGYLDQGFSIDYFRKENKVELLASVWDIKDGMTYTKASSVRNAIERNVENEMPTFESLVELVELIEKGKLISPIPKQIDAFDLRKAKEIMKEKGLTLKNE